MATPLIPPSGDIALTPNATLFAPLRIGPYQLTHRVGLAPLTRNRAPTETLVPGSIIAEYYSQRASPGGLIITEAVNISPQSIGYPNVPGIWTNAQVDGWKLITDRVHKKGAFVFMQLWHAGRMSHPTLAKGACVSASDVPIKMPVLTSNGPVKAVPPRPLRIEEIPSVIEDYRQAALNAKSAGFDGVELHAAHGYLVDQFLNSGTNHRNDIYGGSIVNRSRFLFEVLDAIVSVWGASRVAIRVSPHRGKGTFEISDKNPDELYKYVISRLNNYDLAYLLMTELRWMVGTKIKGHRDLREYLGNALTYRSIYKGVLFLSGGFTNWSARMAVEGGFCDGICFGRWFISNPDLPRRLQLSAPLNRYNRKTFYHQIESTNVVLPGSAEGYTDYPDLEGTVGIKGKYKTKAWASKL